MLSYLFRRLESKDEESFIKKFPSLSQHKDKVHNNNTLLNLAIKQNLKEAIKTILESDPDIFNSNVELPINLVGLYGSDQEVFKTLLDKYKNTNKQIPIDSIKNLIDHSEGQNQKDCLLLFLKEWESYYNLIGEEEGGGSSWILFAANIGVPTEIFVQLLEIEDKEALDKILINLCYNLRTSNQKAFLLNILRNWSTYSKYWKINCIGKYKNGILYFLGTTNDIELIEAAIEAGALLLAKNVKKVRAIENFKKETLEELLDNCIEVTNVVDVAEGGDLEVNINFRIFINEVGNSIVKYTNQDEIIDMNEEETMIPNSNETAKKLSANSDGLVLIAKSNEFHPLLSHPVVTSFRDIQWNRFVYYFFINLFLVFSFLVMSIVGMYLNHWGINVFYGSSIAIMILGFAILKCLGMNYKKIFSSNIPVLLIIMLLLVINNFIANETGKLILDLIISILTMYSFFYLISITIKYLELKITFMVILIGYVLYIVIRTYWNLSNISEPMSNITMADMMYNETNSNNTMPNAFMKLTSTVQELLKLLGPGFVMLLKTVLSGTTFMYLKRKHNTELEIIKYIDFVENINSALYRILEHKSTVTSIKKLKTIKAKSQRKIRTNSFFISWLPNTNKNEFEEKIKEIVGKQIRAKKLISK